MNKKLLAILLVLCILSTSVAYAGFSDAAVAGFSDVAAAGFSDAAVAGFSESPDYSDNQTGIPPPDMSYGGEMYFAFDRVIVKTKTQDMFMSANSSGSNGRYDFGGLEIDEIQSLDMRPNGMQSSNSRQSSETLLLTLKNTGERNVVDAIRLLNSLPDVEFAEPDYIVRADYIPNDPYYGQLYGMNKISAPAVWDLNIDCSSIIVAVIDTGIDFNHPDLAANIWTNPNELFDGTDNDGNGLADDIHGWNFVDDNNNVMDDNGHGTHVAGTIGAVGNNGIGVAGVAWNVKLVALKILNANGQGYVSDSVKAVNYAAMMGFPVSNNSYGGGEYSEVLRQAVMNCNGIFVAAAGNNGSNNDIIPHYPSNYDCANVISVASTDSSDNLSYFSNYGANTVHIAAPGSNIISTYPNNKYQTMSGTSMAAPHVTGAAAVVMASDPMLSLSEVIERIIWNSDTIPGLYNKTASDGRLNVLKALSPVVYTPVESIVLNSGNLSLMKRESFALKVTVYPSDATNKQVHFLSDNPLVASVSASGLISGLSDGTTEITAISEYNNAITASCVVTVSGELPRVNFTDMAFKQAVIDALKEYAMSSPGDDPFKYYNYTIQSDIYPNDVQQLTRLVMRNRNIGNLTGIEYFTNLTYLDCIDNQINEINVTMLPGLTTLLCSYNLLTSFDFDENNSWNTMILHNNYLDISNGSTLKNKLDIVKQKAAVCEYTPQLTYIPATGISLSDTTLTLNRREARTIKAEIAPLNATNKKVYWESGNETIATVSEKGVIIARAAGSTVITAVSAENPSITASCSLTVLSAAVPIAFKDMAFKANVVDTLKRNSSYYDRYTINSDIYPDDLSIIQVLGVYTADVTDMSEISYFSSLIELAVYYVSVKELDLSQLTSLQYAHIGNSIIEYINASNLTNLTGLTVYNTKLKNIDLSGSVNLTMLNVSMGNLTSLDLTGLTKLSTLMCYENRLKTLNISRVLRLTDLRCNDNKLESLDLTKHESLDILHCQNNDLKYLGLNAGNPWFTLHCSNNYLDLTPGSAFMNVIDIIAMKIDPFYFSYSPQRIVPLPDPLVVSPAYLQLIDQPMGLLTATVNYEIGDKTVLWTSGDMNVAEVDQFGVVKAIGSGSTTIRAELAQNSNIFVDVPVSVTVSKDDGDGTPLNPFKLRTKTDIILLSMVGSSGDFEEALSRLSACYILEPVNGAYIDMEGAIIQPIGFGIGNLSNGGFSGVFDGNGKEIRNLNVRAFITGETEGKQYGAGLFSHLRGGTVKNLTLANITVEATAGMYYSSGVGGLTGAATGGFTIDNVSVSGAVSAFGTAYNIGGAVGYANYKGQIKNSAADVRTTGYYGVGGFVGVAWNGNELPITNCRAYGDVRGEMATGGFIGTNMACIFSSSATGNVFGGEYFTGGFEGRNGWGEATDCYATGNVTGENYVGGFLGFAMSGSEFGKTENCYAAGNVSGANNVGGFVGQTDTMEFFNCYATGDVTAEMYAGGFMGFFLLGTVVSNYSSGSVYADSYAGGFVGAYSPAFGTQLCQNNYSASAVEGKTFVGGFAGAIYRVGFSHAYAAGNVKGNTNVGGFTGYKDNEIAASSWYRFDEQTVTGTYNTFGMPATYAQLTNSLWLSNVLGVFFEKNNQQTGLHPKLYKYNSFTQLVPNQPDIPIRQPVVYKPGDINRDGDVNVLDLSILLANFGKSGEAILEPKADLNKDGDVNVLDLSILLANFGK